MHRVRRATAVLILIAAGFLAVAGLFAVGPQQAARKTVARIVRFGSDGGKYHPSRITVVAADDQGVIGQTSIEDLRFACQVGDAIPATRQGVSLMLDLTPCLDGRRSVR